MSVFIWEDGSVTTVARINADKLPYIYMYKDKVKIHSIVSGVEFNLFYNHGYNTSCASTSPGCDELMAVMTTKDGNNIGFQYINREVCVFMCVIHDYINFELYELIVSNYFASAIKLTKLVSNIYFNTTNKSKIISELSNIKLDEIGICTGGKRIV